MTVYVYTTASILKAAGVDAQLHYTVNNRTTEDQTFHVIVWNTSSGTKVALFNDAGTLPGNNSVTINHTISPAANVDKYEIEFRLSSQHMVPYVQQKYIGQLPFEIKESVYAGELFMDFTTSENP